MTAWGSWPKTVLGLNAGPARGAERRGQGWRVRDCARVRAAGAAPALGGPDQHRNTQSGNSCLSSSLPSAATRIGSTLRALQAGVRGWPRGGMRGSGGGAATRGADDRPRHCCNRRAPACRSAAQHALHRPVVERRHNEDARAVVRVIGAVSSRNTWRPEKMTNAHCHRAPAALPLRGLTRAQLILEPWCRSTASLPALSNEPHRPGPFKRASSMSGHHIFLTAFAATRQYLRWPHGRPHCPPQKIRAARGDRSCSPL